MNVVDVLNNIHQEIDQRAYFTRVDVLDQSKTLIKACLYISPTLFVQIYCNDRFDTISFVLIYNKQRIYARDRLGDLWHRHTVTDPHSHDTSIEGSRAVTFSEFLDEVESVLSVMGLP